MEGGGGLIPSQQPAAFSASLNFPVAVAESVLRLWENRENRKTGGVEGIPPRVEVEVRPQFCSSFAAAFEFCCFTNRRFEGTGMDALTDTVTSSDWKPIRFVFFHEQDNSHDPVHSTIAHRLRIDESAENCFMGACDVLCTVLETLSYGGSIVSLGPPC